MSLEERRWALKRELAGVLRSLVGALPTTALAEAELAELLPSMRAAARRVVDAGPEPATESVGGRMPGMELFHERGALVGLSNPVAPPLRFWADRDAGVARGSGRFGSAYEGAPGLVHGGFVAAALDELLGFATMFSGSPGMTGEITIRFLRPTPIDVDLQMTGRFERQEGRRLFLSGELAAGGQRTAEAHGVFIAVGDDKFQELDQKRRAGV